jgi:hypothetical protein
MFLDIWRHLFLVKFENDFLYIIEQEPLSVHPLYGEMANKSPCQLLTGGFESECNFLIKA